MTIRQRTGLDCGVTALAIFIADRAARQVVPGMRGLDGCYNRELIAAAKRLGVTMRAVRRYNLDVDEGILRIRWNGAERRVESPGGHFVAVIGGSVHDPSDASARPWRDYVITENARPCTLLKVHP